MSTNRNYLDEFRALGASLKGLKHGDDVYVVRFFRLPTTIPAAVPATLQSDPNSRSATVGNARYRLSDGSRTPQIRRGVEQQVFCIPKNEVTDKWVGSFADSPQIFDFVEGGRFYKLCLQGGEWSSFYRSAVDHPFLPTPASPFGGSDRAGALLRAAAMLVTGPDEIMKVLSAIISGQVPLFGFGNDESPSDFVYSVLPDGATSAERLRLVRAFLKVE